MWLLVFKIILAHPLIILKAGFGGIKLDTKLELEIWIQLNIENNFAFNY